MFKFIRRVVYFFVLLSLFLILAHNMLAGWLIRGGITRLTGFHAFIGSVNIPLTRPTLQLRDIAIRNPPEMFHDHRALEINKIEGNYDFPALLKGRLRLSRLILDIPQVVVVRNGSGETNLKMIQTGGSHPKPPEQKGKESNFQIDVLTLSLGEVLYVDEKAGATQPRVFKLNIQNRTFHDLKSSEDIKKIVMILLGERIPYEILGIAPHWLNKMSGSATNFWEKGKNLLNNLKF